MFWCRVLLYRISFLPGCLSVGTRSTVSIMISCCHDWSAHLASLDQQQVTFRRQLSAVMKLIYGIPQGSGFGPLLFFLYTSELLDIIKREDMMAHSYADDTQVHLITGASDARTAAQQFVSCTAKIEAWMSCNRLKMNAEKTQVIWIGSRQQLAKVDIVELQLLSANVHFSTTVYILGVHFFSQLTIRDHVTATCRSCFFFS